VPKRCHRRPSPRCLLGRLGGDVMPKPCLRRLSLRCLPPSRTRRHTLHTRSWHAASLILSVSAQPTLADRPSTFLGGAPSAPSSPSPPSRDLPTGPARSWLGHRPRCAQRYRPAGTSRDGRHTAPVDGHYTPQRVLRNQSRGLAGCGEIRRGSRLPCSPQSLAWSGKFWRDSASKSPIVRNPSHGLAGCGEIR
jgi:hypothetical protein